MRVEAKCEGPSIFVPSWELVSGWFKFSQIAASRDLTGELVWCPFSKRSVRTTLIVFLSPVFDDPLCFIEIVEPVGIQALGAESPVEVLGNRVVSRLARSREVDLHSILIGP